MQFRLLEFIRCPSCRSALRLLEAPVVRQSQRGPEVVSGTLRCNSCGTSYLIEEGVPRLVVPASIRGLNDKARTASTYGYLWNRTASMEKSQKFEGYHFDRMSRSLRLAPHGLVLDAGCGAGIDLVNQARVPQVEIIGVELSGGGCRQSFHRSSALACAHVVQSDVCRLPFADGAFDFIYSYGVLHHLSSPQEGLHELVRVLKPGATIGVYLYEDLGSHGFGWRWLLQLINQFRRVTSHLSHRLLFFLCQLASPIVYLIFTLPFRLLNRLPGLGTWAAHFPFRHASGPFQLVGDLYDRFSAPIEWRYSRAQAVALLESAGLQEIKTALNRGWMVSGVKPSRQCT